MGFQKLVITLFLIAGSLAYCQTSKGTISGTIFDSSGAVVANAQIVAKGTLTGETRTVSSGANGQYNIEAITPGIYSITVSLAGFTKKELSGIDVRSSLVTSENVTLEVGSSGQTITVEAALTPLQTQTGDLSGTITASEIAKLPINSLNPIDLVLTQPGVVAVADRDAFTNGSGFSANGLRPRANNFLIDGFDNNDQSIGGQALQPNNVEAIKEVTVLRNSYAAEFGRGGASVTNVIYKNGTNEYHGSLWERFTGNSLNALSPEEQRSGITANPRDVDNAFGFSVGGPIVKNKLFLFGSSQWHRIFGSETGGELNIPTAQGVSELNTLAASSPNAALLVSSLGGLSAPIQSGTINVGNRAGCGSPCLIPIGQFTRTPTQQNTGYEFVVRADYQASEKDTFSLRYIGAQNQLTPDLFANASALPTQDTYQGGPARNVGAFWTHVFRPSQVNEARFTFQQIDFTFGLLSTAASSLTPNITIAGLASTSFGGTSSTFPQGRGHNDFGYQDAYTWTVGRHSVKAGVDINRLSIADEIALNSRGSISYVAKGDCSAIGLATCTGLANFLDNFTGPAGNAGRQFGNPNIAFAQTTQAYYVQDVWKILPSLTMTYGVRYEYFSTPFNFLKYPAVNLATALTDPITTSVQQKADRNNFGPRVGIAWNPNAGKTVVRAGGGMFYDGYFTNIEDNVASSAPNTLGGTLVAPSTGRGLANASGLVPSVTARLNPLASVSVIDSRLLNPVTYQWNVAVERQLGSDLLGSVSYVGTRASHLFINQELNPGVDGVRLNPARGSIGARTNNGDSIYHALQADLKRKFRNGLLFEVGYTFSKAIDDGSEVFVTSGGSSYPQDPFNVSGERGLSAFDRRHRGTVTAVYTVPFRAQSGMSAARNAINYAVRNWTFSGTAQLQTGAPDTIHLAGYDENGDLRSTNDRPDTGNPRAPINYSPACYNSLTCITGVGQYQPDGSLVDFNTGASGTFNQFRYIVVSGRTGNTGRNTFINDWTQDYAFAVERIFPIPHTEHHQLEFRAEGINPFNHPNPGLVSTDLLDPNFLNRDIQYTGSRVLNLWLKYRF